MSVRLGKRLRYDHLFDDEPLEFQEYFKGISKNDIFKVIPHLINVAHPNHKNHLAKDLINDWFYNENVNTRNKLLQNVRDKDSIANIISSLWLMEFVLQSKFDDKQSISDSELKINLFKAYLLLNSKQDKIEEAGHKSLPPEEDFNARARGIILTTCFHDSDLTNYDLRELVIIQLIKSIEFFKYLENREELNPAVYQ